MRALAERATPGPWQAQRLDAEWWVSAPGRPLLSLYSREGNDDAAYIAAHEPELAKLLWDLVESCEWGELDIVLSLNAIYQHIGYEP